VFCCWVCPSFLYYLLLRSQDLLAEELTNRVLLFVLRNVNAVLVLTILFVLVRNLFKLALERHHKILGSKFKTKLVATYIGLSLIPVLLLFAYATELLQGSIDKLFEIPVDELLEPGYNVSQALTVEIQNRNLRDAARVVEEIEPIDLADPSRRPRLSRTLRELQRELGLDFLAVYEDTDFIRAVLDPQAGLADLPEPRRDFLLEAVREGEARGVLAPLAQGQRLIVAAATNAPESGAPRRVIVAGTVLDAALAADTAALVQAYQGRRQLELQEPDIRTSYLLLFVMVTLVILLTSSWMGLYLARRITVPIQALADGTRRIMGGDLSYRVDAEADDELGVLIDSFNRMTGELQKNKDLLEQSNRELVTSNQRLDEERALVAAVLENVDAGVISIDADGRVLTCNHAALEMLRQSEDEVLGRPLREAWSDPERSKLLGIFDDQSRQRGRTRSEIRLPLGVGWKTFEAKVTAMRDEGERDGGYVVVLEDLTELIQAQKLATWTEAARRVAHEIKNPLTPIKLSAERLLVKLHSKESDLRDAVREGVETIVREVDAMKSLVDEFARFARMPSPQPGEVDLERLVRETTALYRDVKPGLEIRCEVRNHVRASLDGEQVRSALINLLDNAVEATPTPGRIDVTAAGSNGSVLIEVADTGPGIPAEDKEKLFLPYYSTKGRGSGLGLAIVHRIVTDHHGSLRVADNRPRGTVFIMEFPQG
jgi:two-component system nitrogen regulation sensor histidine kinase NtrY